MCAGGSAHFHFIIISEIKKNIYICGIRLSDVAKNVCPLKNNLTSCSASGKTIGFAARLGILHDMAALSWKDLATVQTFSSLSVRDNI